jgi:DNA polymerase I
MRHIIFQEQDTYSIAVLIKASSFVGTELQKHYVDPIDQPDIIGFTLNYDDNGKAPAKLIKEYLNKLLPALNSLGVKYLYVADSNYFKTLAGVAKADNHVGYVMPCKIKGYDHMNVVLGVNYQALIYNPKTQVKLDRSIHALKSHINNSYVPPGKGIIHSEYYPKTVEDIASALELLYKAPSLVCDIETFGLRIDNGGIGTVAFSWDEHNGVAFAVDYKELANEDENTYGIQEVNEPVRKVLKEFLTNYKGNLTFHRANFDARNLVYNLWMEHGLDYKGMLEGIEVLTKDIDDTLIIAYLATNSTAGNQLSLKHLAHEFAGAWAMTEIKDIRKIPLPALLKYNLVDCLSTFWVRKKYEPIMIQDNQQDLYNGLMKDSLKLIIQIELTGMPMSRKRILEVNEEMVAIQNADLATIMANPEVSKLLNTLQVDAMNAANAKLKVKQHPLSNFSNITFNPNSPIQLVKLLFNQMELPVLDLTPTKQPATGGDTLEKLLNHTDNPVYKELLDALISYMKVTTILSNFMPKFLQAFSKDNSDIVWLHGSFNIGGTVSGRLSSSDPNLQNLPSNSKYSKLIKSCFVSPPGKVMAGADFNSLEDMISALTTKDPNKLKVYIDGYCGHCLRAFYYFKEQCTGIVDTVTSINSIKKLFPELRQLSKTPTFLLTYGGTHHGLMSNLGWPKERAKNVEDSYHELYEESDKYITNRLHQASKDGYTDVAFGLRLRTPLLSQVIYGSKKMPYEASEEGRTAANAMGQSYGLLNNRAAAAFMKLVHASKYRYDIVPISLIHDAIYIIIKDDVEVVKWANDNLIKCMQWQELPEIQHDQVKLGAELDVYYGSWDKPVTLKNNASIKDIYNTCEKAIKEFNK